MRIPQTTAERERKPVVVVLDESNQKEILGHACVSAAADTVSHPIIQETLSNWSGSGSGHVAGQTEQTISHPHPSSVLFASGVLGPSAASNTRALPPRPPESPRISRERISQACRFALFSPLCSSYSRNPATDGMPTLTDTRLSPSNLSARIGNSLPLHQGRRLATRQMAPDKWLTS